MPFPLLALAIPAAISGITSIIGGIKGSKAAKTAAQQQVDAIEQAKGTVNKSVAEANPLIAAAADKAATGVTGAAESAAAGVEGATGQANELLKQLYQQFGEQLDPYLKAGGTAVQTIQELMAPGGEFSKSFTAADMEQYDPGFAFRLEQGQKALERSAAARGLTAAGGTMKALDRYSQGLASEEYGKAFERFQSSRRQRYDILAGLMGAGQTATGQAINAGEFYGGTTAQNLMRGSEYAGSTRLRGSEYAGNMGTRSAEAQAGNITGAARTVADLMTSAGAAKAGGTVGSANAWTGALNNIGRTAMGVGNMLTFGNMMKPGGGGVTGLPPGYSMPNYVTNDVLMTGQAPPRIPPPPFVGRP